MSELLSRLVTPALVGLILTASCLVIFNDWRLSFAALAAQYLFAAALVAQIVIWQVAAAKVLAGLLVVGILIFTGSQAGFGRRGPPPTSPLTVAGETAPRARFEFPTSFPFRLLASVMIAVAAGYLASQPGFALPGLPLGLNLASYLLLALGLLNLGLTEEPMNAGTGLLTLLTGFELLYAALEPSLAVAALLAAVEFGVALAVSYLALLQYAAAEKESGG